MASLLSISKAKNLRKKLDNDIECSGLIAENLAPKTVDAIKASIRTALAYHDLAAVADEYVKDIDTKIELGHKIDSDMLEFMRKFSEIISKG